MTRFYSLLPLAALLALFELGSQARPINDDLLDSYDYISMSRNQPTHESPNANLEIQLSVEVRTAYAIDFWDAVLT